VISRNVDRTRTHKAAKKCMTSLAAKACIQSRGHDEAAQLEERGGRQAADPDAVVDPRLREAHKCSSNTGRPIDTAGRGSV